MSEQEPLVVETQLTKEQFIRLSILRHFQRTGFYFTALTSGAVAAYAWFNGLLTILLLAWAPLLLYVVFGVVMAWRDSQLQHAPFLPTRYEFSDTGVHVRTEEGSGKLYWADFATWREMVGCYVLVLTAGAILAIPQKSVPPRIRAQFEALLNKRIAVR